MQNKEQFTPKPWIKTWSEHENEIYIETEVGAESPDNTVIATIYIGDSQPEVNNHANANLIAAAPDMYEALKEMIDLNFYEGRDANIYFHVGMNESRPQISTTLQYIFKKMQAALLKANPKINEK